MGLFSKSNKVDNKVDWIELQSEEQVDELLDRSVQTPVLFFKHSTRCSISTMAKNRLESKWDMDAETILPVYLDLIKFRSISNKLAEVLNVIHQSPQIILVDNKDAKYNASHNQISVSDIKAHL